MNPRVASMHRTPARSRTRRTLLRLAALPLVAYAALLTLAFFFQGALIFPRYAVGAPDPFAFSSVDDADQPPIRSADGTPVIAWFIPGNARDSDSPGACVLFAHGNGELIDHNARLAAMYQRRGVSTLLVEYRGYGSAPGTPSQRAIVADFLAARKWLDTQPQVDPARVIYHGRSLGGGVLIALADVRAPAAVIIESTFTSMRDMFRRHFAPGFICRHPFENARVLPGLGLPTLIMHGSRDTLIPPAHGKRLADMTPGAVYKTFDCGHNDLPPDFIEYERVIAEFLAPFTASDQREHPR